MDQVEMGNRQKSLSNQSSINTPKLRKRLSDFKKDSLVFSQILKKDKHHQSSENNSVVGDRDKQESKSVVGRMRKGSQNTIVIKQSRDHMEPEERARNLTPCHDLHRVFVAHKLSQHYVSQIQKQSYKSLVIVGIILPTQLMKKISKLIDLSQDYKLSLPQTIFATDFTQLPATNSSHGQQVTYVFWTYEIPDSSHGDGGKNFGNSGRYTPASNRSVKDLRRRKVTCDEQYAANMKNVMVEVPHVLITTKNFIQDHTHLFFPQLLSDIPTPSSDQQHITLQPQLNIEKSLLYIDEQQLTKSQKCIPTPKYMQTSSRLISEMKRKNPEVKSNAYIELEPDEEYFNQDERDNRRLVEKGELDKLNTARSNDQLTGEKDDTRRDSNLELFDLLEKDSIFKHVSYLPPFLLQGDSSFTQNLRDRDQALSKKSQYVPNERTRKNSLSTKNVQRERLQKFKQMLGEHIKASLKRNFHYSRFCCSWIFLHFLTNFYQHNALSTDADSDFRNYRQAYASKEYRSIDGHGSSNPSNNVYNSQNPEPTNQNNTYSALLIKSLRSFKKQIQLRYMQRVQNQYKGVLDEPTLRNVLRTIKMDEIVFMKKNLASIFLPSKLLPILPNRNPETQLNKEFLAEIQHQITHFMDRIEDEIYFENNKLAIPLNYQILQTDYEKIIEAGFRKQKLKKKQSLESNSSLSEQRSLKKAETSLKKAQTSPKKKPSQENMSAQLQRDFTQFMQAYASKGIKVSSQMKTFSDFMQKMKQSYLKNIHQLTKQKKSYEMEEEQKENKQQIMKLLEMEIFRMEDKKKEIKDKNELIKREIKNIDQKGDNLLQFERQDSISKRKMRGVKNNGMGGSDGHEYGSRENSKNRSFVEMGETVQKQRRLKKATSFAFEIENSRNKRYIEDSGERNRGSFNRYSNKKSMEGENVYNYNREDVEEESARVKLKNRCLTCCEVM